MTFFIFVTKSIISKVIYLSDDWWVRIRVNEFTRIECYEKKELWCSIHTFSFLKQSIIRNAIINNFDAYNRNLLQKMYISNSLADDQGTSWMMRSRTHEILQKNAWHNLLPTSLTSFHASFDLHDTNYKMRRHNLLH